MAQVSNVEHLWVLAGASKDVVRIFASEVGGQLGICQFLRPGQRNIDQMRALASIHGDGAHNMSRFGRKDIALASKLAARIGEPAPIVDFVFDLTKKA